MITGVTSFQSGLNGSTIAANQSTSPNLLTKPVPPPRDHLKIEKDGRLVNRAPAPQLPARINNNNNITSSVLPPASVVTPTPVIESREQLDNIRKYQVSVVELYIVIVLYLYSVVL